jgi:hypothetical protein
MSELSAELSSMDDPMMALSILVSNTGSTETIVESRCGF